MALRDEPGGDGEVGSGVGGLWVGQAALLLFFLLPPSLSGQESGWSAAEAMALPIPLPFPSLIEFVFFFYVFFN